MPTIPVNLLHPETVLQVSQHMLGESIIPLDGVAAVLQDWILEHDVRFPDMGEHFRGGWAGSPSDNWLYFLWGQFIKEYQNSLPNPYLSDPEPFPENTTIARVIQWCMWDAYEQMLLSTGPYANSQYSWDSFYNWFRDPSKKNREACLQRFIELSDWNANANRKSTDLPNIFRFATRTPNFLLSAIKLRAGLRGVEDNVAREKAAYRHLLLILLAEWLPPLPPEWVTQHTSWTVWDG